MCQSKSAQERQHLTGDRDEATSDVGRGSDLAHVLGFENLVYRDHREPEDESHESK